jgi:uncharacterized protein (TIGR02145 family)
LSEPEFREFSGFTEFLYTGSAPWLPFSLEFFTHKQWRYTMSIKLIKIAFTAVLGIAIIFTISCSGGDEGGGSGGGENVQGGCPNAAIGNNTVTCGGKTYKTVKIGTQTWMAENLNYAVSGSVCYDYQESNCDEYGRLYDWSTAMALPSSCNSSSCVSQIGAKHKGICPSGWHLPSDVEWTTLENFVGEDAGIKLKTTSGWKINNGTDHSCDGTDNYGFSALPGGDSFLLFDSSFTFDFVGENGDWWSATEYNAYDAYCRDIYYYSELLHGYYYSKTHLYSVRCVKD